MADGAAFMSDSDTRALRDAFGRFVTGVTVVTTNTEDGPVGMTANSFSSVSLDPPLVMWALASHSLRAPAFEAAQHFTIHVLGADQLETCNAFAKSAYPFDAGTELSANGVPLLPDCIARFECKTHAIHPGGDHKIIVGRVLKVTQAPGDALTFFNGQLGRLTDT